MGGQAGREASGADPGSGCSAAALVHPLRGASALGFQKKKIGLTSSLRARLRVRWVVRRGPTWLVSELKFVIGSHGGLVAVPPAARHGRLPRGHGELRGARRTPHRSRRGARGFTGTRGTRGKWGYPPFAPKRRPPDGRAGAVRAAAPGMSPIEFEVNYRNRFAHKLKKLKFVVHDLNRRVDARLM